MTGRRRRRRNRTRALSHTSGEARFAVKKPENSVPAVIMTFTVRFCFDLELSNRHLSSDERQSTYSDTRYTGELQVHVPHSGFTPSSTCARSPGNVVSSSLIGILVLRRHPRCREQCINHQTATQIFDRPPHPHLFRCSNRKLIPPGDDDPALVLKFFRIFRPSTPSTSNHTGG